MQDVDEYRVVGDGVGCNMKGGERGQWNVDSQNERRDIMNSDTSQAWRNLESATRIHIVMRLPLEVFEDRNAFSNTLDRSSRLGIRYDKVD
jgi:predicted Fe-S protein YdhL (DUF1289 family)